MKDYPKLDLNLNTMSNFHNPLQETIDEANRIRRKQIAQIDAMNRAKEEEALRRHNELVEALRNSSANIVIGDNAKDIQIQQNSSFSTQNMEIQSQFDYEKVAKILNEIRSFTEYEQFQSTYGRNTESVKALINDTLLAVQEKQEPNLIKKALNILKDLTIGVTESLIASGILSLLGSLAI